MWGLNFSYKCFIKIKFVVDNHFDHQFLLYQEVSQVKHFEQCAYDEPKANRVFSNIHKIQ